MARSRPFLLSRLRLAWLSLASLVALGALFVWLAPSPRPEASSVVIPLPAAPERDAAADVSDADAPMAHIGGEDEALPPSSAAAVEDAGPLELIPVEVTAEAPLDDGGGEVIITLPDSDEDKAKRATGTPPSPLNPQLVEETDQGRRPAIGVDGVRPFDTYRRGRPDDVGGREAALIVSGLGIDAELTEKALKALPPAVSLSFAPYAKDLEAWVQRATEKGHEVMIEIPMEAKGVDGEALGPAALLTERPPQANQRRLEWIMSRTPAYGMMTNYLGSTFSQNPPAMAQVLATTKRAGVAYLDDTGRAEELAAQVGTLYGAIALVVPPGAPDAGIRLDEMIATAERGQLPVAKVYAAKGGLEAALAWAKAIERQDIQLVPASAAVGAGK